MDDDIDIDISLSAQDSRFKQVKLVYRLVATRIKPPNESSSGCIPRPFISDFNWLVLLSVIALT